MAARNKRFTVYDMMEVRGDFEANPANKDSPEFTEPVVYPKMLYHPEGKTRVTVPSETIVTPYGPKEVGEQREIIYTVVKSKAEEKELRDKGWHDHPAKAIAAGGGEAPAMSSDHRIRDLEAEIAKLTAELAGQSAGQSSTEPNLDELDA